MEYDPEILEIVQFGSSVYIPDYAQDLDLLVYTKRKKGSSFDYLKALDGLDLPGVDLILHEPGEPLDGLTLGVMGANRVIYGEGEYMRKSIKDFDPSFDEAWAALETAKGNYQMRSSARSAEVEHDYTRTAFNKLAHAARMASLVYLAKEGLGWTGIEDALPSELGKKFNHIFRTLHVEYFYHGNYPQTVKEEFSKWEEKVKHYIKRLESESGEEDF